MRLDVKGRTNVASGASSSPSRSDDLLSGILGSALIALGVVPGILTKFLGAPRQQAANRAQMLPAVANYAQYLLCAFVLLLALFLTIKNIERISKLRGVPMVVGVGLLWLYLLARSWALGQEVGLFVVLAPCLAFALWLTQPSARCLVSVGYGGLATAVIALLMGLAFPEQGLYANDSGQLVESNKGLLLSGNFLSGPFTSTNNLGQFLTLSLPFMFFARRRLVIGLAVTVMLVAILWSGSRSSIIALAVAGVVGLMASQTNRHSRNVWGIAIGLSGAAAFVLPFLAASYPKSFSGRGNIWRVSLSYWEDHVLFGLGPRWFAELSGLRTELGSRSNYIAFHAHNQFLHLLVTGGLVGLALLVAWMAYVANRAWQKNVQCIYAYGIIFLVSGTLELNLGVIDRYQFYATSLFPFLVVGLQGQSRSQAGDHLTVS